MASTQVPTVLHSEVRSKIRSTTAITYNLAMMSTIPSMQTPSWTKNKCKQTSSFNKMARRTLMPNLRVRLRQA